MPNDVKLGLVVGLGLVVLISVVYFRKEPGPQLPDPLVGASAQTEFKKPNTPPPLPTPPSEPIPENAPLPVPQPMPSDTLPTPGSGLPPPPSFD